LIVEHLCNLANIPDNGFKFSAVPPKFKRRTNVSSKS
jgi:arylformamidase